MPVSALRPQATVGAMLPGSNAQVEESPEIFTLRQGTRQVIRMIMGMQRKASDKPIVIYVKGDPATGKTTLVKDLILWLDNIYGFRVGIVEERALRRSHNLSAEQTRNFTFQKACDMHSDAAIIIVEGVKNLIPRDTENLDIFIKTVVNDEQERIKRLEKREGLVFHELAKQGIELAYTLKQVREGPDYPDRTPDIIVDNTIHDDKIDLLDSLESGLNAKTSSSGRPGDDFHVPYTTVNNIKLPDIELYLSGLSDDEKRILGTIEFEKHYIKHEIKGKERIIISRTGKDFNEVYWIKGTMLVEKKLRQGLTMASQNDTLLLAMNRLRGLAAKTYLYNERVIQEYVEPLLRHKDEGEAHSLLIRVDDDEATGLIDQYFELFDALLDRGVFDIDFNLFNCGRNAAGNVVIFDFGAMTTDYPDEFDLSRIRMALERELNHIRPLMPEAVWGYYEKKMEELCGDNSAYNNIHRNFYNRMSNLMWKQSQNRKRKGLGVPHPYPLKALRSFTSSSSGYVKDIGQLKKSQLVSVRRINKITGQDIWVRIMQVTGIDLKAQSAILETTPFFRGEKAYTYFGDNAPTSIEDKIRILEDDFSLDKYPDIYKRLETYKRYYAKTTPARQRLRAIKAIKSAA
jgi:hypothetical protein